MNNKDNKIKVKVKNLSTGKESVSYIDPNAGLENTKYGKHYKELTEKLAALNPSTKLHNNNKLFELTEKLAALNPKNRLPAVQIMERFIQSNPITAIQDIYSNRGWLYEYNQRFKETLKEAQKQAKEKGEKIEIGKPRMIREGEQVLKASNQILGLVCYYSNKSTPYHVREFLESLDIDFDDKVVHEVTKFRNKFYKAGFRIYEHKKATPRQISSRLEMIRVAKSILDIKGIKGKQKSNADRKILENYSI